MTWYYSELLFKLGTNGDNQKFCESAPVYTRVVEMDPDPKAKYLKEAAYAAVISWKNCLAIDDSGQDTKDSQIEKRKEVAKLKGKKPAKEEEAPKDITLAEKPIEEKKQKMIEAFDTYIKYVPAAPELVKIKWNKARIYYEYNHFDEAIPLFKDIVDNHRQDELAIYAANLLLDCYSIKKN